MLETHLLPSARWHHVGQGGLRLHLRDEALLCVSVRSIKLKGSLFRFGSNNRSFSCSRLDVEISVLHASANGRVLSSFGDVVNNVVMATLWLRQTYYSSTDVCIIIPISWSSAVSICPQQRGS